MDRDPWKHRSQNMRCITCMYFVLKEATAEGLVGRCRRHAPTMTGYPVVYTSDWCGDHKLDENKATFWSGSDASVQSSGKKVDK